MCNKRFLKLFCGTGIFAGAILLQSQAQDFLMAHKNASAGINITNANAGVTSWSVDGVNSLNFQGFYYRVGGVGPEASVQSISSTPTVSFTQIPNVLSKLDVTYANASFSVRTLFQLTGSTAGSGTANLSETITVQNLSGAPLDFHLFQYSNFDLWGLTGGQTAQFLFDSLGQPYKVTQTDGSRSITETVNANTAVIGHYEAALGNLTLTSLMDGGPTTLSDTATAGPGDATFAYQWDATLAANGTITISKLMTIVPEPTIASLLVATLGAMAMVRRNIKSNSDR